MSSGADARLEQALAAWGQVAVTGPLGGGHRNTVAEVRLGGQCLVARRSRRGPGSLDWELALLDHLARNGLRVPVPVPALDGRRHVDGVVVLTFLDGTPPGPGDGPAVAATLRRVHQLTADWPQRPGFASTTTLLTAERGGDVDLRAMPATAAADCRQAWAGLAGTPQAVVHGDAGPGNIRVTPAGAGLLDWDEARVDSTDLDLAELTAGGLPAGRLSAARLAITAWEAASGWITEPAYARRQLELLRAAQRAAG